MTRSLPRLIAALLEPGRYPEPTTRVELIETHASWLFLAGDYAYKIKKAVSLPFLDYGTLERREAACVAELKLNQHVSPELYLAVVAITGHADDPQIGGNGEAIEYAVKMRRFPERNRLDHLCSRRQLEPRHLSDLATTLARLHAGAAVAAPDSEFGAARQILAQARDNFSELYGLLQAERERGQLTALEQWTEHEFDRLRPCFERRKASGAVRECHGDLHLANLVLLADQVRLFDCIEFSDELRWIDVASELAFPYVDLIDHDRPDLAGWLLSEWLSRSGDYGAATVLRFYAVYRLLVRGKVSAIRARQTDEDAGDHVARSLALAQRLTTPLPPRLVLTHGVAGCGKSRAAKRLLMADPFAATIRVRADVERKRLFALADDAWSGSPLAGGIYTTEASDRTYSRLLDLAGDLLAAGWSVVVDATFLERARRDAFRALAKERGATFALLAPSATPAQLEQRIRRRMANGKNVSEATLDVLALQRTRVEALGADELEAVLPNDSLPDPSIATLTRR